MGMIAKEHKALLGQLLAKGHARFGRVADRLPYYEDEGGDSGTGELRFESHPLLADMPVGAPSDLTMLISEHNPDILLDEALERKEEATPELKKQPAMQLNFSRHYTPTLTR